MFLRFVFLLGLAASLLSGTAQAQDYAKASWPNMLRTMVRFNALNLADPALVDEYAIVTECDLYKNYFHDDFKWNQVRQAVVKSVQMNVATFPTTYKYDAELQLDRYDFTSGSFRLTPKTMLHNVNTFVLYDVEGTGCGDANVKIMPRTFRAVLSGPIYIEGLPLAEKDAKALLDRMNEAKNTDRILYARFNMRIVFIEPLRRTVVGEGAEANVHYEQSNAVHGTGVRLDARLDSIDFYEDPARTRLVYQYQQ